MIHVTPAMVNDLISSVEYKAVTDRTTVCIIHVKNGMEIVGLAQRQATTEHNQEVAEKSSYSKAFDRLYEIAIAHYNK